MTHRIPASECTNCGRKLDAADTVSKASTGPKPGDYTICLRCGHLMIYGEDHILRNPTSAEITEIAGDPGLIEAQAFSAEFRRRYGGE